MRTGLVQPSRCPVAARQDHSKRRAHTLVWSVWNYFSLFLAILTYWPTTPQLGATSNLGCF